MAIIRFVVVGKGFRDILGLVVLVHSTRVAGSVAFVAAFAVVEAVRMTVPIRNFDNSFGSDY